MNVDKLTIAQADEEIAKYEGLQNAAGEEIVIPAEFKSRQEHIDWLKSAQAGYGIPHEVTEEDLIANDGALQAAGVEVGDTILLPLPTEPTDEERAAGEAAAVAAQKALDDAKKTKLEKLTGVQNAVGLARKPEADIADTTIPVGKQAYHNGSLVILQLRKVVNGKLYNEIHTATATFLLTDADYQREISIR